MVDVGHPAARVCRRARPRPSAAIAPPVAYPGLRFNLRAAAARLMRRHPVISPRLSFSGSANWSAMASSWRAAYHWARAASITLLRSSCSCRWTYRSTASSKAGLTVTLTLMRRPPGVLPFIGQTIRLSGTGKLMWGSRPRYHIVGMRNSRYSEKLLECPHDEAVSERAR